MRAGPGLLGIVRLLPAPHTFFKPMYPSTKPVRLTHAVAVRETAIYLTERSYEGKTGFGLKKTDRLYVV